MPDKFSVVIVCKNEKDSVAIVLQSLQGLTDDVLVYDNGSTDGTLEVLQQYGVNIYHGPWMGFGKTKQKAVLLARYDWVLCLDADESVDTVLYKSLQSIALDKKTIVYQLAFKNLLGEKQLQWGEWGTDKHIRLFNRTLINWDEAVVHESLQLPKNISVQKLKGYVLHRTIKDTTEYSQKMVRYAMLNAEKYFSLGKRSSWIKRYINPNFSFVKHYIFQLGFLDGWAGLLCARMSAFYTFLKYARLKELWDEKDNGM